MFASLATLAHKLSTRSQRYIISLKNKVEYFFSMTHIGSVVSPLRKIIINDNT